MSPLWSDKALAEAGWANAAARDSDAPAGWDKPPAMFDRIRRIPRPRLHSFAL